MSKVSDLTSFFGVRVYKKRPKKASFYIIGTVLFVRPASQTEQFLNCSVGKIAVHSFPWHLIKKKPPFQVVSP